MRLSIEFATDDEGEETKHMLPARYAVCTKCEGHGTHLNPSIGEHAFSREEFEEAFDDEGKAEYFRRGGIYDVQCEVCHGSRVVPVVDRDACRTPDLRATLAAYDEQQEVRREGDTLWRNEIRMQEMMGMGGQS